MMKSVNVSEIVIEMLVKEFPGWEFTAIPDSPHIVAKIDDFRAKFVVPQSEHEYRRIVRALQKYTTKLARTLR